MTLVINIDGELYKPSEAKISVLDRGFLYGDSVYEVVRTYDGRIFALPEHMDRLERSASRLDIRLPEVSWVQEQIVRTIEAAASTETYCRVVITRGTGPITLDPTTAENTRTIILAKEYEAFPSWQYERGIKVTIPAIRRNSPLALDPAIKSGNYLNSVMALGEARKAGFDDALMLGVAGRITEATSSNVFIYQSGKLRTPALASGILQGVTRGFVIKLVSEMGMVCEECELYPQELADCEEVMLTSTLREVMPVVQVGRQKINQGKPGPVAKKLREAFHAFAINRVRNKTYKERQSLTKFFQEG